MIKVVCSKNASLKFDKLFVGEDLVKHLQTAKPCDGVLLDALKLANHNTPEHPTFLVSDKGVIFITEELSDGHGKSAELIKHAENGFTHFCTTIWDNAYDEGRYKDSLDHICSCHLNVTNKQAMTIVLNTENWQRTLDELKIKSRENDSAMTA